MKVTAFYRAKNNNEIHTEIVLGNYIYVSSLKRRYNEIPRVIYIPKGYRPKLYRYISLEKRKGYYKVNLENFRLYLTSNIFITKSKENINFAKEGLVENLINPINIKKLDDAHLIIPEEPDFDEQEELTIVKKLFYEVCFY